jgi:decaprenylphospho-beta-D-erythro-pentofuranosid-2-ulose 2-reductase
MQKKVIVGATSAMAEHVARHWVAEAPIELILIGRDAVKLEQVMQDLKIRSPHSLISTRVLNFLNPDEIKLIADEICSVKTPHCVLIAHGALPVQATCQTNLTYCKEALEINAISPVLFAEAFVGHLERANYGTLAIIGSVAGDRGRKSNYIYGAAKGLLLRFAEGLQHRLAGAQVKVVLIHPGPTDTPMTSHLKEKGVKLASVERVASEIYFAIQKAKPIVYAPKPWKWIMRVIKLLPRPVFNRLDI